MKKREHSTKVFVLYATSVFCLCFGGSPVLGAKESGHAGNTKNKVMQEVDPLLPANDAKHTGRLLPSEIKRYVDPTTRIPWTVLTDGTKNSKRVYQTDPSFTYDGKWILLYSNERHPDHTYAQGYLVNRSNGQFIQITEGNGVIVHSMFLSRKEYKVWYTYKASPTQYELRETDIGILLEDAAKGVIGRADRYTKTLWQYPDLITAGGISLDADERKIYVGFLDYPRGTSVPKPNQGTTPIYSRIMSFDFATRDTMTVVRTDFQLGHLQANPWVAGQIAYCWETGGAATNPGDAPLRMWVVNSDGSGNRPLYDEIDTEWITHESWAGPNQMAFCSRRGQPVPASEQTRPTGICVVEVGTGTATTIVQVPVSESARGFWHCNAGNNRWYAGDTNEGKVYLFDNTSSVLRLLTAGHPQKPDHTHPIFSPDNRYLLIQTGIFSAGKKLDLMMVNLDDIPASKKSQIGRAK